MIDDFDKMDKESGVQVIETPQLDIPSGAVDIMSYRSSLVKDYYGGSKGILERLADDGKDDTENLLQTLIIEVIKETDHLLGNQLVAAANGDLRDSSVISYKRTEALEKAVKAISAKRAMEKESGIDLDSPSMQIIFRFFMSKANDSLVKMNVADEMKDIFFATIGEEMETWKMELKEKFKEMRAER